MQVSPVTPRMALRRLAVGMLAICGVMLAVGLLLGTPRAQVAQGATPVKSPGHEAGHAVRDKQVYTSEEIMNRFPRAKHEEFMRRAIANSRKAGVEYKTGGAFGAVIVSSDGTVLADGINEVIAQNDPSWHAEVHAIRQACALLKSPKLNGCILYTSSEPCPMCLAAVYWAGLDGIVYGATVADSTKYGGFDDGFIYVELAKPVKDRTISEQRLLEPEAVEVWKEYEARTDKIPY